MLNILQEAELDPEIAFLRRVESILGGVVN